MGNFFTSTQIYNTKQLDREQFISFFCEEMKKNGYVPGNSDESEVSYIFRFADDCKWVTITSEDYDEGNQLSQTDTSRLAKMLKTTCINTTVIDSDCAVMEMYNKSGQKDDTLIMGRADDYFGDEITQPSMKAWKPFLAEGRSWEQFCDIVQDSESYTFIEDGLSELATVIGMDESEILFHSSVAEEDEQTVFLYFTKAAAKEKKISFIAAFKQVFGEMLEPLGYKYLKKGKYPYFVKLINNEILHIISYRHISSSTVGHKAMEIHGGAISLYRRKIDLTGEPDSWLPTIRRYYNGAFDEMSCRLMRYECNMSDNEKLINDMKEAAELVKEFILSVIADVTDLESYVKYAKQYKRIDYELCEIDEYENNPREDYNESYLLVLTHDDDDGIKRMEDSINRQLSGMSAKRREENEDRIREQASKRRLNHITLRDRMINDKELFKRVKEILQTNKANNLEMLKGYGIIESQNEKKLTLKAAFIQVFGEALEPLGFVKAKSKYPYYLRVVGEGIIQGFSVSKEKSFDCDPNEEGFSIYVGVSLLSLPLINFDKNPVIIDNQQWMISLNELYRRFLVYLDEFNEECKEYSLFYKKGKSEEMLDTLRKSRYEFMPFVLEYLEKLKTLEDIYQAGDILPGINDDAIILLDRIDEQIEKIKKHLPEKIKMLESVHANNPASFEVLKEHYIKNHEKRIKRWTSLKKGGEAYDDYMKTAEKTKEKNMRVMENLGVIPKKG